MITKLNIFGSISQPINHLAHITVVILRLLGPRWSPLARGLAFLLARITLSTRSPHIGQAKSSIRFPANGNLSEYTPFELQRWQIMIHPA